MALELIICLLNVSKCELVMSMKRCCMTSKGHVKSFSASCVSKKASWTNLFKWCFK
jgi:hypothetical protein